MSILTDIREFFFPRLCVTCGARLLQDEKGLCLRCAIDLPYTHLYNTGNEMEKCFWGRFPIERASALLYYAKKGKVADILHAMKYYGQRRLCVEMGRQMAEELIPHHFFDGIDYIIPVPLHRSRLRSRGYNQSELLAQGISGKTGIPLLIDAIVRTRNNATQTHKGRYARWENAKELFCKSKKCPDIEGKHVLLIDDVLTTGATLISCADAIADIPQIRISILTLAWAK